MNYSFYPQNPTKKWVVLLHRLYILYLKCLGQDSFQSLEFLRFWKICMDQMKTSNPGI